MNDPSGGTRRPGTAATGSGDPATAETAIPRKRISSAELMGGEREILIDHSGSTYRLRRTSQGKLILTK